MDKLENKKSILDGIRLFEGSNFECDDKAISEEYDLQRENKSSLSIKILSIFGGLMASVTFLIFIAIAGIYESEFGLLILGIAFVISAIWLNKAYDKLIIDTFSISIYIIGFALTASGLSEMKVDETIIALLICIIALCSLMITQNYIMSFISVLAVSGSFLTIIFSNELFNLIHLYIGGITLMLTYLMLNEAKIISSNNKLVKLYDPIRIGLVFALLAGLITIGKKQLVPISENYIWLSSIVMIIVLIYLVHKIIQINEIDSSKNKILIYALSALILTSTLFAPSISGAIIIILLSFMVNYKTGFIIGIISLIYFISQYYYDLNLTLLNKSIILFSTGILFLLFYFFTVKNSMPDEKI